MHLILFSDSTESGATRGRWGWLAVVLFAAAAAAFVARSVFFVDESQYVFVTQFGETIRFHSQPGIQLKWPYQSLLRFDRRLQVFEPSAREMLTQDKENLNFSWYVCWRLPSLAFVQAGESGESSESAQRQLERHVLRFLQSAGTLEIMENRLDERVQAALAAEIGRLRFDQLVSLDPQQLQLDQLADRVMQSIRSTAADQFGIEVVDVRLKRITYPDAVRPSVFAEIRSERERVAVQYRAEGASEKAKIQSQADLQREQLLAHARQEALVIRGAGEAKAIEIFNQAHGKDPQFYELLKTLETYRSILDGQTTVVMSSDSPLLKLLTEGLPELPGPSPAIPPSDRLPSGPAAKTAAVPPAAPDPVHGEDP
jgi:membrane protease subunit HflC